MMKSQKTNSNCIGHGAEAIVTRTSTGVEKLRTEKSYRHPDIDYRLRRSRTRREAKILEKIGRPKLLCVDDTDMRIEMEYINAPQLREVLTEDNAKMYAKVLAAEVRNMHDKGIIHGDLTTSNILAEEDSVIIIDFGLSFFAEHVEHKAVDLHTFKEALKATHPDVEFWKHFKKAYNDADVLKRLEAVEKRGRYKGKSS